MATKISSSFRLLLAFTAIVVLYSQACATDDANPSIAGGVPFFYYNDLNEAAEWYEKKLGLKKVTNEEWVIIFELTNGSYLGLVNATGGSLKPTEDKGALLSIETAELEAWYEKLKDVEGINMVHGIEVGADGMIEEFRMVDPGGYIIEFFRWRQHRPEAARYAK
jgi:catechol 2,3-dioxygenase-like lactoylglutathione lyase family enzyme